MQVPPWWNWALDRVLRCCKGCAYAVVTTHDSYGFTFHSMSTNEFHLPSLDEKSRFPVFKSALFRFCAANVRRHIHVAYKPENIKYLPKHCDELPPLC